MLPGRLVHRPSGVSLRRPLGGWTGAMRTFENSILLGSSLISPAANAPGSGRWHHACGGSKKGAHKRMYVAIRQYGLLTNEPVENVMRGIREGFIPIINKAPGFLAYYALDSGGGTLTSISIFEHRAGAERSNKLAED